MHAHKNVLKNDVVFKDVYRTSYNQTLLVL